ncbi:MAG: undecaprenyl-phosphate glucose phosphotransferase, partial [Bacteroidetes bacterium]|nr:undecaprenyl-phosphate glucose phosphotransferase [Bacteroidota bacterium]
MIFKTGRYSGFLRPFTYVVDLVVIHVLAYYFFQGELPFLNYILFISIAWIVASFRSLFYEIYRFTHLSKLLGLLGKQSIYFVLIVFTFFGFYNTLDIDPWRIIYYILIAMSVIG